jgi:hypothetical protein
MDDYLMSKEIGVMEGGSGVKGLGG